MEAPEIIWLSPNEYRSNEPSCFWSESQRTDYDIKYISKNTFIEKACVKLKKLMYDNLMFQGRWHREEVIDNFVEDFKKYMKEE